MRFTEKEKEKIIEQLIQAGAKRREKPLTPNDHGYSESLGKKGEKIITLKF